MSEREFPARVVGVEWVCSVCRIGTMVATGAILASSDPVLFPHVCDNCSASQNLTDRYPTFRVKRA